MEIRRDILARIVQEINLEVAKPNLFQAIVAKQNDYGSRFLKVTFVNNGEKIYIEDSMTATINAERPDGLSKRFDAVVNDDGTVTAPLVGWMLELQGLVNCDISVMTDTGKLTTTDFTINVNEAACSDSDISADEDYDILKELIVKVEKMEEEFDPSNYVTKTQFADNASGNAGVVRIKSTYGITSGRYDGNSPQTGDTLLVLKASENQIKHKTGDCNPIVPSNLDYAVKMALIDSKIEWTEAEKKAVRLFLGIEQPYITILEDYVTDDSGNIPNVKINVGEKYIVSVYNEYESHPMIENKELTVYEETVRVPDIELYVGMMTSGEFYYGMDGTEDLCIQQVTPNNLQVKFTNWSPDGMPTSFENSVRITLIKVNE